jgi:tetratricopeptide (TPR) repeat protein
MGTKRFKPAGIKTQGAAVPSWWNRTTGRWIVAPFVVVLAVALFYGRAVDYGLVNFDDDDLLVKFTGLTQTTGIKEAFFHSNFKSMYRPMLQLSFYLDAREAGPTPKVFHRTNILIHLGVSLALLWFLGVFGFSPLVSTALTLLFVSHPVVVPAVCWISGRNDSLLLLFMLPGMIAFIKMLRHRRWQVAWLAVHLVCFFAAILTKETALALPLLCVAYYYLTRQKRASMFQMAMVAISWVASVAAYAVLRRMSLADASASNQIGLAALWHNLPGFFAIAGKLFLPLRMSGYPAYEWLSIASGIVGCVLLAAAIVCVRKLRTPGIYLGIVWVVACYAPVLMLKLSDVSYDYLEHRAYACMPGVLLVVAGAWASLVRPSRGAAVAAIALIGVFCLRGYAYEESFKDARHFWGTVVQYAPQNTLGYTNLANALRQNGELAMAAENARKAISLDGSNKTAHNILCATLFSEQRYDEAIAEGRAALAIDPTFAEAAQNTASAYANSHRYAEAEQLYLEALRLDPNLRMAKENLAKLRAIEGRQ